MNNVMLAYGTSSSSLDNFLQLLGLILLFTFILLATYGTSKFVGKMKLGQLKNKNFEVIETMKVAPSKYLQLVRMGNKYVVISINKDDVKFITELEADQVELPTDTTVEHINFQEIMSKFVSQGKKK